MVWSIVIFSNPINMISYNMHAAPSCNNTSGLSWLEKHSGREMATVFARGAQTMNTMFFKPAGRKAFHKKSTSSDMIRETRKFEGDEMKGKSHMGMGSENDGNISWVPHERTGIYYPKGQEKVMEEVSPSAGRDMGVNWFT